MKIARDTLTPFDFEDLEITDCTAGRQLSSTVGPGVRHRTAWSKRSDKYYLVLEGALDFTLGSERYGLGMGDCVVVPQGTRFSYRNASACGARLLLVHTPSFDLEAEVFEDDGDW